MQTCTTKPGPSGSGPPSPKFGEDDAAAPAPAPPPAPAPEAVVIAIGEPVAPLEVDATSPAVVGAPPQLVGAPPHGMPTLRTMAVNDYPAAIQRARHATLRQ